MYETERTNRLCVASFVAENLALAWELVLYSICRESRGVEAYRIVSY
jgi:hypothetical protein